MKYTVKCKICGEVKKVNGQKQISEFTGKHKHGDKFAGITGKNVIILN